MRKPKNCNGSSCEDCEPAGCAFCQPCAEASGAAELTSEQKLERVREQIRACELGAASSLLCPYCGAVNQQGRPLCCRLFAAAALAVFEVRDLNARVDLAGEIAERAARN